MRKSMYRPVGLVAGAAAGLLAGAVFKQLWKSISGGQDAPEATDEQRHWGEILLAAALQGAIYALVKAAIDRAGATSVRKLTGSWPD